MEAIVSLIFIILIFAGFWGLFTKMGDQGWKALIPIYNTFTLIVNVGRPGWWILLLLIPLVNIVVFYVIMSDLARGFQKGFLWTLGLFVFPYIFIMILGFNGDEWRGRQALA